MLVTIKQVLDELLPDEPDYERAAERLGPEALPHLEDIVKGEDPLMASKAASLASLIKDDRATVVLKAATESKFPEVRTAAAFGAKNISNIAEANEIISSLKRDTDNAVRIHALQALRAIKDSRPDE
jgi:HEAT repeat protein